jgi:hypothetical protein
MEESTAFIGLDVHKEEPREGWKEERTAMMNRIRGLLACSPSSAWCFRARRPSFARPRVSQLCRHR